jgi:hypothetical protein
MHEVTMPRTEDEIAKAEEEKREIEEAERDLVRSLIEAVKFWQHCEHRVCRRMRRCVETQTCQTRYAGDIRWYKRTQVLPYLRKRYPTVRWGTPEGIGTQLEAARAAEQESKARQQARKEDKPIPRKRRRKRVRPQPLHAPRDFAGEAGNVEE